MTKPTEKERLAAVLIQAINDKWHVDATDDVDISRVRDVFGLAGFDRGYIRPEIRNEAVDALVDAALAFTREPIDIEKAAQEFLRGRLMALSAGDEKDERCAVKLSVKNDGYGDITFATFASIGYSSAITSPFLDTAIAEARRREGYDEANKPMVLIEPPKVEPETATSYIPADDKLQDEIPF